MHLAFALFRYFPFGGMQRDMLALARLAARRGHRATIFCHTWQGEQPSDVEVQVIPVTGTTNHGRARNFDCALQEQLQRTRPDIVIGGDKLSSLDFYFAADPCFVTRTADRSFLYRLTPRYRAFRELEGKVFAADNKTRILMLDPREQANYEQTWQTPPTRFTQLPPGIARDRQKGADATQLRTELRNERNIADDAALLLLLAANFELKGLDRAMRALAALPPEVRATTRLLAVGAPASPKMRQLAQQLNIADNVTMLDGRTDVPRLLQAADVLVHPARRDTTGTVLLEAVAAELPVLCTAACGYANHITDACCGRVVPEPFSQATLNEHLQAMLATDRTAMQDGARAYCKRHDLHGMHDYVLDLVESSN